MDLLLVGASALSGQTSITKVIIGNGVTTIDNSAFNGCSKLKNVTFKSGSALTTINSNAFYGCSAMTGPITIPTSVKSIGTSAFQGCSKLTSVLFESGSVLTMIDDNAFKLSGLTSITIPNLVTSIGNQAFNYCSSLTSVSFDQNSQLKTIEGNAFSSCSAITGPITIPNLVTSIENYAFNGCTALTSVTFESGSALTTIGQNAFAICSLLTEITIPTSVKSIGTSAFQDCSKLTSVTFALGSMVINTNGVISGGTIGQNAFNPSGLETVYAYSTLITTMGWSTITPTNSNVTTSIGGTDVTVKYLNVHATTFSMSNTNLIAGQTSTVTLIFSEAVTGFNNDDITVQNGSLNPMTSSDNIKWTGTFTPTEDTEEATNVLTLSDDYTNNGIAGIGAESANYKIDTTAPVLTQVTEIVTPSNNTTPTYVFSSTQSGTITYSGGNGATSSTTDAIVGENSITFNTLAQDTYDDITITVTDAVGNVSDALPVSTFVIDTTKPVLTQVTEIVTPSNNTTPTYVFSSTQAGTMSYTGSSNFSPPNAVVGENSITFNTLVDGTYSNIKIFVTDDLGNVSNGLTIPTFVIDTTEPTMNITAKNSSKDVVYSGSITNDATITLTFTSNEATNNFTVGNISFTNGLLSNFTGSESGEVYTAIFTPSTNNECSIQVNGDEYSDTIGNPNKASDIFTWTQDITKPSMNITSTSVTSGATTNNASINLTFTSSEATNDFVNDDITLVNGTLSAITGSGKVYSATFTPTDDGVCTIDVAANEFTDGYHNYNEASDTFTWTLMEQ